MEKETKDRINKRKIAYVYLLHRMFEGSPTLLVKTMRPKDVKVEDLEDWDGEYREAVYATIREEDEKGVSLRESREVPTIKSIKDKVLRRCYDLVNETTDPSKLATVYKVLSEFEASDEKKEKNILDAINEIVKPGLPKREKKAKTMLEKMREERNSPVPEEEKETNA